MGPASVTVNGRPHRWRPQLTLAELLRELGAAPGAVAVERNGRVVPRAAHDAERLEPGDRLELVRLVGGG